MQNQTIIRARCEQLQENLQLLFSTSSFVS